MMPSRVIIFQRPLSFMICMLGEAYHVEELEESGVDYMAMEGLRKMNEKRKLVKKFSKSMFSLLHKQSNSRSLCFLVKVSTNQVLGLELHRMIDRVRSRSKQFVVLLLLLFPVVDGDVFSLLLCMSSNPNSTIQPLHILRV